MNFCILALTGVFVLSAAAQTAATPPASRLSKEIDKEIKLGTDEPGCKDSALLARVPGCNIIQCDTREVDTLPIQIGVSTDGDVQIEEMDGPSQIIYYLCPGKVSASNIVKVSEGSLLKAGYKTVYNGKDDDDQPIVTLLKDTQWIQISTYPYNNYHAYIFAAIQVAPEASSEAMADEINNTGRVVLDGISFEKDNPDLPADAERILSELAAFLVRQPELRIRVEGHAAEAADEQGNIDLSKRRASAVAAWLLEHGIDKTRITIEGAGASRPDASGDKAKNQRIEIVKI